MGDIQPHDAHKAIVLLAEETRRIVEHPITEKILAEAEALLDRHRLRALDAIQLASALVARFALTSQDSFEFVASDRKLLDAAAKEGLSTWNPAMRP